MTKKELERVYFDRLAALCPDLSGTTVESDEAPDFICKGSDRIIGVEVTRLFQNGGAGQPTPMAVFAFREQIVARAKEIYSGVGTELVRVGVLFEDIVLTDREAAARKLADHVVRLSRARPGDFVVSSDDEVSLSPEFALIRVIRGDGLWSVSEAQMASRLSPEILQEFIGAKSSLVPSYRTKAGEAWLLLVLDRYPLPGSFTVPESSLRSIYATPFDRVYLLLSMEQVLHRLSLTRL
jgi:hypothetical protein